MAHINTKPTSMVDHLKCMKRLAENGQHISVAFSHSIVEYSNRLNDKEVSTSERIEALKYLRSKKITKLNTDSMVNYLEGMIKE